MSKLSVSASLFSNKLNCFTEADVAAATRMI